MKQIVHLYTHFNIFESIGPSEVERETIDLKVIITERYKTMTFIHIFFLLQNGETYDLWKRSTSCSATHRFVSWFFWPRLKLAAKRRCYN